MQGKLEQCEYFCPLFVVIIKKMCKNNSWRKLNYVNVYSLLYNKELFILSSFFQIKGNNPEITICKKYIQKSITMAIICQKKFGEQTKVNKDQYHNYDNL